MELGSVVKGQGQSIKTPSSIATMVAARFAATTAVSSSSSSLYAIGIRSNHHHHHRSIGQRSTLVVASPAVGTSFIGDNEGPVLWLRRRRQLHGQSTARVQDATRASFLSASRLIYATPLNLTAFRSSTNLYTLGCLSGVIRSSSSCSSSQYHHSSSSATNNSMRLLLSRSFHGGPWAALLVTTTALVWSLIQPQSQQYHTSSTIQVCQAEKFRLFSFFDSKKRNDKSIPNNDDDEDDEASTAPSVDAAAASSSSSPTAKASGRAPEAASSSHRYSPNHQTEQQQHDTKPPFYGKALKPIDVHYNTNIIMDALATIRKDKRTDAQQSEAAQILSMSGNDQHTTLTLIGYKGGEVQSQINQDRALIVAPYTIQQRHKRQQRHENVIDENNNSNNSSPIESFLSADRILLGVFDGHAPLGELVSEYTTATLPVLLAQKLVQKATAIVQSNNASKEQQHLLQEQDEVDITKAALIETFVEIDKTAPANPSGGCTASVILYQGSKIYIANAGDSRSFIVSYRPSTNNVTVVYISREDKPSLPDERARIEAYGGQVYIPARGTSRVVYHDSTTGAPTGLAMSRSIGDWEAGKMGVIPDPIVNVIDTRLLVASILMDDAGDDDDETDPESYQVDPIGNIIDTTDYAASSTTKTGGGSGIEDDVYLFAVSATDGMMDYVTAQQIAGILAHSLFHENGVHPITAIEHLIFEAARAWQTAKQGRYRDDIAIAVSALRRPPSATTT